MVRKGFGLYVLWPEQSFGEFSSNSHVNGAKKFTGRGAPGFLGVGPVPGK